MIKIGTDIDPRDLYEQIVAGEIDKDEFEFWVNDIYDQGFDDGQNEADEELKSQSYDDGYGEGFAYGFKEGMKYDPMSLLVERQKELDPEFADILSKHLSNLYAK